jgi:RNA polymerase sigma factor (sigma-70 family)
LDDLNSAQFVGELQTGSTEAFDRLVTRLLPPLFKFLTLRMNVPDATAEEVAADVLMTVHGKLGTFRFGGRAKLTTWIFEIAKNRAIDYHRSQKHEFEGLDASLPSIERHAEPEHGSRTGSEMVWIRTQLAQLSERDQQILKWRALDFPFGQIAEWVDMSEGAVRVRHKRALDKLKENAKVAAAQGEPIHE